MLVSSVGDEKKIDRWETYDPATPGAGPDSAQSLVAVEEDSNGDGRADRWEKYSAGRLQTASFDENRDGRIDRRLTYQEGTLVLIESEPDAAGKLTKRVEVK